MTRSDWSFLSFILAVLLFFVWCDAVVLVSGAEWLEAVPMGPGIVALLAVCGTLVVGTMIVCITIYMLQIAEYKAERLKRFDQRDEKALDHAYTERRRLAE